MAALAQVTAEMAATTLSQNLTPMNRNGFGTKGRKYLVKVNAFELDSKALPSLTCAQYDVKIVPADTPPILNRQIWKHLQEDLKAFGDIGVVYDGRALAFATAKLPGEKGTWKINLPEDDGRASAKGRQFEITIMFTRKIALDRLAEFVKGNGQKTKNFVDDAEVQGACQALNIAVQHSAMMDFPNKGASFYLPPRDIRAATISQGITMWAGFYSSLRPGPNRIFLNVDITSAPMYSSGNLPDIMMAYGTVTQRGRPGPPPDITAARIQPRLAIALDRFLRGVKVQLKIKQADGKFAQRKIKQLTRVAASQSFFETADGKKTSVAAYFKTTYKIALQRPDWPCILIGKIALWPIELCEILPGQKFNKKLSPDQTAESLLLTTVGPKDRVPRLLEGLAQIQPVNNASALMKWGVKMKLNLMEVTARELQAPKIVYGRGKEVTAREGVWDIRDVKSFHTPKKIDGWLAIVFDDPRGFSVQDAKTSLQGLAVALKSAGMVLGMEEPPIYHAPMNKFTDLATNIPSYIQAMGGDLVKRYGKKPSMIICFLARKPCEEYAIIKRFGDVDKGVPTQCLFINKAKKGNPQYYANISLKMNVKMSGINSVLDKASLAPLTSKVTMVFGADVTHPSPGSFAPSIAAVVGSMDVNVTQYGTSIKVQGSRVEVIENLDDNILELLKQFIEKNKKRPAALIMFRDGVSDGQFSQVLSIEVNAIRLACQRIDPAYKPSLTLIVCGKRHHFSFFPSNPADGDRKNGNVKAGMTVDTDITSPFFFDWYTQSHASLLGTGRSAHYTVLVDDAKFSADVLQSIVYNLCYTYSRCTRSVSYATPAYYADRVCTRAQLLIKGNDDDASTVMSGKSGESEDKIRARELSAYSSRLKAIHVNHKEALYFM